MTARAPRLPVSSLRPGEVVTVHLKGRALETINSYGGTVVEIDAVALRLDAAWSRFSLTPSPASGEIVVPWSRIDRVRIEGAGR